MARLEQLGVPTAFLVTDAFTASVAEQLPLLGMATYLPVWVPHPIAGLAPAAARERADAAADAVRAVLTGSAAPAMPARDEVGRTAPEPGCDDVSCAVDLAERGTG
jgi:hypothetical protein